MSIVILNVSKVPANFQGWCDYEVRINLETVARFKHRRDRGLEVCLRRAASALANEESGDMELEDARAEAARWRRMYHELANRQE